MLLYLCICNLMLSSLFIAACQKQFLPSSIQHLKFQVLYRVFEAKEKDEFFARPIQQKQDNLWSPKCTYYFINIFIYATCSVACVFYTCLCWYYMFQASEKQILYLDLFLQLLPCTMSCKTRYKTNISNVVYFLYNLNI